MRVYSAQGPLLWRTAGNANSLGLAGARSTLEAAQQKGQQLRARSSVAVTDVDSGLLLFEQMQRARQIGINLAVAQTRAFARRLAPILGTRKTSPVRVQTVATVVLPLLSGCSGGVLDPHGPVGAADRIIMLDALGIMLAIVVPTILALIGFAWWFRAANPRARRVPNFVYSGRLELVVWGIPLLVILFLGGVIWIGSHQLDPYNPVASDRKAIDVQVVSLDWKWLFIYPEQHIASINHLVVPAAVPVHFSLTSATVMNSFFVPQLGSMIAIMNGMVTQLYLEADHPGSFYGESTQFSGDGFSDMRFTLEAVPQEEFAAWVASVQQSGPILDEAAYLALTGKSTNLRPFTYRAVAADLFHDIVMRKTPAGRGPEQQEPAAPPRNPAPAVRPIGNG